MPIDIDHVPHHLELERKVEVERALELDRARQKRKRTSVIQPVACTPASGGKTRRRPLREGGFGLTELGRIADGLLEVVADDLVALDESVSVLVEPVGESSMQIGADCLGE